LTYQGQYTGYETLAEGACHFSNDRRLLEDVLPHELAKHQEALHAARNTLKVLSE
jgi:hypothetical protein